MGPLQLSESPGFPSLQQSWERRANLLNTGHTAADSAIKDGTADRVGKELESVFLATLLKEMRQSSGGGLFEGDESDTLGGIFDQYLSQFLANQGGIGLANSFADALRGGQPEVQSHNVRG